MRGLFAIVIAVAVIQIAAAALKKCPPQNGSDVTLVPNPEKCNTYYLCNGGHPFLMTCPDGLYFNPELRICDWTIREEKDDCRLPSTTATTTAKPASVYTTIGKNSIDATSAPRS